MDLYYLPASAPCRAVLMCAKALELELRKIPLNLTAKQHLEPWFLKINPQHILPTLVDNGFVLWESRAIMVYLVEKYGKTDKLYPKCLQKQARINQRLHFDIGSLDRKEFYFPIYFFKSAANADARRLIEKGFRLLNIYLRRHTFVAGNSLTVADFSLFATVSTYEVSGYNFSKFKNVARWYENAPNAVPGWDENVAGCKELYAAFQKMDLS